MTRKRIDLPYRILTAIALWLAVGAAAAEETPATPSTGEPQEPNRVVMARVGSAEIAVSDFMRFVSLNPESVQDARDTEGKARILRLMITNVLLQNAMAAEGLLPDNPTQEDYATAYRALAEQHFPQPDAVEDQQLRAYFEDHREDFGIPASVRLSHMQFRFPEDADDAEKAGTLQRAEDALARLEGGEPFADVARDVSQAPSADNGGDLGFIERSTWSDWLSGAVDGVAVGQHTDLVPSPLGYEILFVADERPAIVPELDDVADKVQQRLKTELQNERRRDYVKTLADQTPITIELEELREEFAGGVFP